MGSLWLQSLLWHFSLGHAGIRASELADRLESTAEITADLHVGWAEVLRGLRNFFEHGQATHHNIDRMKVRQVKKGKGQLSTLGDKERKYWYCFEGSREGGGEGGGGGGLL